MDRHRQSLPIHYHPFLLAYRPAVIRSPLIVEEDQVMADIAELDERIAEVRDNLRELVEQAAAYSGAADEELASQRIADQEALLDRLTKERDALAAAEK